MCTTEVAILGKYPLFNLIFSLPLRFSCLNVFSFSLYLSLCISRVLSFLYVFLMFRCVSRVSMCFSICISMCNMYSHVQFVSRTHVLSFSLYILSCFNIVPFMYSRFNVLSLFMFSHSVYSLYHIYVFCFRRVASRSFEFWLTKPSH